MDAKLIVVGGEAKETEINLKLPAIIGRGREATLTLPHGLVSRQHCEISEQDGNLVVRDLGSLNGTFIDNQRIEAEEYTLLEAGHLLTVGAVTFRAAYGDFDASPQHQQVAVQSSAANAEATLRAEQVQFDELDSAEFTEHESDADFEEIEVGSADPDFHDVSDDEIVDLLDDEVEIVDEDDETQPTPVAKKQVAEKQANPEPAEAEKGGDDDDFSSFLKSLE